MKKTKKEIKRETEKKIDIKGIGLETFENKLYKDGVELGTFETSKLAKIECEKMKFTKTHG